jgi:ParB family chromosome partitioning protein
MVKKTGLGKGFDVLLPQDFDSSILADSSERVQSVKVELLVPDENQPRRSFDGEELKRLAESIKTHGVLQPLIATRHEQPGKYQIVAGERRWRASKLAGKPTLPVIVRSAEQLERLEIALVENMQRVDLSLMEQAASIARLIQQFSMSYDAVAKKLGRATSTISNIVRLLDLPEEAIVALNEHKISEGHARAILALKSAPDKQTELLNHIINRGWSVREAERFVVATKKSQPNDTSSKTLAKVSSQNPETRKLSKLISRPVSIRRTARGGKLEIGFESDKDLEQLLAKLRSIK